MAQANDVRQGWQCKLGRQSLTVSYSGLEPRTVAVTVTAGRAVVEDIALTLDIYVLDSFVVPGEREGNPRWNIFLDVVNVFDSPLVHTYIFHPSRPRNADGWKPLYKFGISGRL